VRVSFRRSTNVLSNDDFPEPFGPIKPYFEPGLIDNLELTKSSLPGTERLNSLIPMVLEVYVYLSKVILMCDII
jgi:hypothetical protein